MLQHVMMGSTVTQIQKMTTQWLVKRGKFVWRMYIVSDFGKVRGDVFKTQRKTNQTKKLTSKRQNWKRIIELERSENLISHCGDK